MKTEHLLMMDSGESTGVPYTEKAGQCGNTLRPATPSPEGLRKGTGWGPMEEAMYYLTYGEDSGSLS